MRGVFNLFSGNLPRFVSGRPIPTASLNALVDAVQRCRPVVGPGCGIEVNQLPDGFALRATAPLVPVRVMVVTTLITAKSGSTAGVGAAKDATFNVATKAIAVGTGPALDVYNYHTGANAFKVGAFIAAYSWSGVLWAFDVDVCTNLQ